MRAIILAAGRGSRMGSLTDSQPKCLTRLAGKTLLDWQLDALKQAGLNDVTVVRGYRGESLGSLRYSVLDNPDWERTNMVSSLRCAALLLRAETCLVSYSDIAYHPEIVRGLAESEGGIAISYDTLWHDLWRVRFARPLDDAETFRQENGLLRAIGERAGSLAEIEGQYMGLLKIAPEGWARIEAMLATAAPEVRDRMDMTTLLRLLLQDGAQIRCHAVAGRWCEVDSEADARLYERLVAEVREGGRPWSHDWRPQAAPAAPEAERA